jgi:small subunit ribosomal protein S16
MAVKIRLTRVGKKRQPSYRVVVADSRSPRDGRYIEQIGRYDPTAEPSIVEIDNERAAYWMEHGAQPSSQVRKLLEISGTLAARPVKDRKVHVVGEAAQIAAEEEPIPQTEPAGDAAPEPEAVGEAADEKVVDMADDEATENDVTPGDDATDEAPADEAATDEAPTDEETS